MTAYQPETRQVAGHFFTKTFWVKGVIWMPKVRSLQDHLNQNQPYLKMRDASFCDGTGRGAPFLAVRQDSVQLLIPDVGMDNLFTKQPAQEITSRRVNCFFSNGELSGRMDLPANIRVSDELERAPRFVAVHNCMLKLKGDCSPPVLPEPVPLLFLNARDVIAVEELEAS